MKNQIDDLNENMILHGHPDFYKILDELKELHNKKNYQYASNKEPLGNFNRVGKLCHKVMLNPNISDNLKVGMVQMAKQIDAVYDMVGENKIGTVEAVEDKLKDIAVYAIIVMILYKENKNE